MSTGKEPSAVHARWKVLFLGSLILVMGLAMLGLLGYLPGLRRLASVSHDYIPMAPSTAICFLILAISSLAGSGGKKFQSSMPVYLTLTLLVSLFGLLNLLGYFTGADLNFEDTIVPEFGELNGMPVGRMSPATGLAFFVAGLASFFLLRLKNRIQQRSIMDYLAGTLNLSVFAHGFVFSLAYFYQKPLFYELQDTIPMALTTALGFQLLSVALIAARPTGFPIRLLTENSTYSYLLRAILPLAVFSAFLGFVANYFPIQTLNLNPAVLSAAITILIVIAAGSVSTWMSRSLGKQIDQQKAVILEVKKQAEQNAAYLYMLIKKSPLPMVITDEKQDIELFNEKFTETYGYTLADISTEKALWQTVYPNEAYREKVQNAWAKATKSALENQTDIEMQQWDLTTIDGTKRNCEFYMIPLGVKSMIVIQDITKRKNAENELIALKDNLELLVCERTNELEAFSYSVSHDLRAPLRHINGYVDLLNNNYRADLPDKAQHYLTSVTDAAKQMGTLIDDLLQLSRTGRQEVQKTKIEMNALVKEVVERIKLGIEKREIRWEIQELPQVFGDYSLLKQVWVNLIDNAVKFSRNKKTAEIFIGFKEEEKNVVLFIRDNGVGFSMKYAHKLFGVFQRLHSQTEFEGTGIGLANVQRIIHKHKGRVWAEAEPHKGAAFFFSLPKGKEKLP